MLGGLVESETETYGWIVMLVGCGRGRERMVYMMLLVLVLVLALMAGRRRPAALNMLIHGDAEFRSRRSRRGRLWSKPSGTVAMPRGCALTG